MASSHPTISFAIQPIFCYVYYALIILYSRCCMHAYRLYIATTVTCIFPFSIKMFALHEYLYIGVSYIFYTCMQEYSINLKIC